MDWATWAGEGGVPAVLPAAHIGCPPPCPHPQTSPGVAGGAPASSRRPDSEDLFPGMPLSHSSGKMGGNVAHDP